MQQIYVSFWIVGDGLSEHSGKRPLLFATENKALVLNMYVRSMPWHSAEFEGRFLSD